MVQYGAYCVVCRKHLPEGVRTCCTAGSVVRTMTKGWFRKHLVYLDADGRAMAAPALAALAESEGRVKGGAEGTADDTMHYGLNPLCPVMTGQGPPGERRYFSHLRCPSGQGVVATRGGSCLVKDLSYITREQGVLCPEYGHELMSPCVVPVDGYEVKCRCGKHEITVFVDMYHVAPDRCIDAAGWSFQGAAPDGRTLKAGESVEHPPSG